MALFTRFFGRTVGEGAGVAIGTATAKVVEPALQELANAAWEHDAHIPLDARDAAALRARQTALGEPGIASGGVDPSHEALYGGLRQARFDVLTELARIEPGDGPWTRLRRRGVITGDKIGVTREEFRDVLRRRGYRFTWIDKLTELLDTRLAPADVANAVQQGFIPDPPASHPGDPLLPPASPPSPDWTPADGAFAIPSEEVPLDSEHEAYDEGVSYERLRVLAELVGLPPGEEALLDMWRRGIIGPGGYAQGLREGHTKTKWTAALSARFYDLLPASVVVNLYLRGWISQEDYHKRMRLHGYRPAQADDWFDASGRPATALQMVKGFRRGGRIPGIAPTEEAHVRKAVVQSDIRPEDFDIIFAGRETIPSAFVMRRLVSDGALTATEAADWLYKAGWHQGLATAAANSWAVGAGTTAKGLTATDLATEYEGLFLTRVSYVAGLKELGYSTAAADAKADAVDARRTRTARNALIARIHSQYVAHKVSRTTAVDALNAAGIPARVRDTLLPDWDAERGLTADALTAAQIKSAWKKSLMTRVEAVARLEWKGYDEPDANIYLDE